MWELQAQSIGISILQMKTLNLGTKVQLKNFLAESSRNVDLVWVQINNFYTCVPSFSSLATVIQELIFFLILWIFIYPGVLKIEMLKSNCFALWKYKHFMQHNQSSWIVCTESPPPPQTGRKKMNEDNFSPRV